MNNIAYALVYVFSYLLSLLPYRILYVISDVIIYPLIYHVAHYRRHVVRRNLRNSFPDKSEKELRKIEVKFYHYLCDYFLETIKLLSVSKSELMRRMTMEGFEELERSAEKTGFAFILLGHYCNWEYITSLQLWVSPDVKCAQIYAPLRSKVYDRLFLKIRSRFGNANIKKNESIREIIHLRHDNQKTIVGFISDQGPRWVNIHLFVPFLHQDTPVFTGTERIAKKLGASIFIAHHTRPKRGYYHCTYTKLTDTPADYAPNEITRIYMHDLEKQIQAEPYLWLWTHDRWKRQRTSPRAPEQWKATIVDGHPISDTPIETR